MKIAGLSRAPWRGGKWKLLSKKLQESKLNVQM